MMEVTRPTTASTLDANATEFNRTTTPTRVLLPSSSLSLPRSSNTSSSSSSQSPRRRAAKAVLSVWRGNGSDSTNEQQHHHHHHQASGHLASRSPHTPSNAGGYDHASNRNDMPRVNSAVTTDSTRGIGSSFATHHSLLRPPSSADASIVSPDLPTTLTGTIAAHSFTKAVPPFVPHHRSSAGANFHLPPNPQQQPHSHSHPAPHHQPYHHPHSSSNASKQHGGHHHYPHGGNHRPSSAHQSASTLASASAPAPSSQHPSQASPPTAAEAAPTTHHHLRRDHHHPHHSSSAHHEPKYDADFDRGTSSRHQSSSNRNLFNPDAPPEPARTRPEARDESSATLAPSSSSLNQGTRKSRSKRDVVDPLDLGRRVMKDSKESIESEESVGRPASRSSKEGGRIRRSRRDDLGANRSNRRLGDENGESTNAAAGSSTSVNAIGSSVSLPTSQAATNAAASSRQLFDPRRDDPVKFAQAGGPASSRKNGTAASLVSESRSVVGSVVSLNSIVPSHSSEAQGTSSSSTLTKEIADDPVAPPSENPVVAQLKRAYREIVELETKLQDENKAALAALAREDDSNQGVRIKGSSKKYDDDYWVKLTMGHKQLADAHYSFMQMALDPRLPVSLHSLPQKYNIPTRLWQTGFHQLLERMRHAVVANIASTTSSSSPKPTSEANVMEHLVEFIQYAYGHYSQLFEDPAVNAFRSAWIEQLGDLARYRMAVAGLASRVAAQSQPANGGNGILNLPSSPKDETPRPAEAASIGVPALNDWDLEEQETWRVMARDWYGRGIAEAPGTGRLHHHLALLSKGDELRGLYHYVKSLTAAHPYLSARESILPLFEEEHQARRAQPDVTKAELFVHLHGMLFTKISLDDFDDCLQRFLERLQEEAVFLRRAGDRDWASLGSGPTAPFGEVEWFTLGVINIAALLQYGAEDGVLKKAMAKETHQHPTHSRAAAAAAAAKAKTPQAIMLNPASMKRAESKENEEELDEDEQKSQGTGDVVMPLQAPVDTDDPLVFRLAQRLTFALLEHALSTPSRVAGESAIINPYITLILTFLGHVSQFPGALRRLERAVPWSMLVELFNRIPSAYDVRPDAPIKLTGSALPEDWCIRGMDWVGKSLFSRGFWKSKSVTAGGRRDDFAPPPPIEGFTGTISGATVESEMDALRFDLSALDQLVDEEVPLERSDGLPTTASAHLASMRWRRLATIAGWLARNVAGLDVDAYAAAVGAPRFVVSGGLDAKLRRWQREDKEAEEAERQSKLAAWQRAGVATDDDDDDESSGTEEDEEEDEEDEHDSATVRELKARRRHLKAVIKQARLATRETSSTTSIRRLGGASASKKRGAKGKKQSTRMLLKILPGYTVLVFDTNILLTSMKLLRDLVEAETWTIIVPLAVVTELDGLRRNESPLGNAAAEAIEYLETAIRTYNRYLKIQTSNNNYLRDLSIRSEAIDFGSRGAGRGGFSHDSARSMDDVILRAVHWQKEHFLNRLAIVNPKRARITVPADASQVVLVTFDRNLRLKARARSLDAADESGMALMLEGSEHG